MAACGLSKGGRSNRVDPQVLIDLPDYASSTSYFLGDDDDGIIPPRTGDRPDCEYCLPHAQMTEQSPDDVFEKMKALASELMGDSVRSGKSTVSLQSTYPAYHLVCQECNTTTAEAAASNIMPLESCMTPGGPTCGTEFAHVHTRYYPAESEHAQSNMLAGNRWQAWQGGGQGSMHVCLTLKDAATVLQHGWGERHVLAGNTEGPSVPLGLVLLYAPRTDDEIRIVLKVLEASWRFAQSNNPPRASVFD